MATRETTRPKGDVGSEAAPDNIFELLVHVANTSDLEMGMTLHVNGQVLTGKLISGATFWAESAAELRERTAGPVEVIEALASSMDRVADEYREDYGDDARDADGEPMWSFVHLRDTRTLTPEGPIPASGALWRGRLASIDGFSLGELRQRSMDADRE